ncbi:MAG: hypothetical protein KatS3mg015_2960 [Fimbriimonadales bacterium]|nr:MAG: hypothetical protein KatS3mg015_2960 [Fimbriimonadales bacterium]
MSSNQSGEGEIRKNIIEADLVDCMVALPGQLFYSTQIPVCLWFLARSKKNGRFRDRRGQTLFIDARKMGTMIDRVHRELTDDDIRKIADTYHAWRGDKSIKTKYKDVPGFCKSATLDDIRHHGYVLTPGRYVGAAPQEDDGEPFENKMKRLTAELKQQQKEAARLDKLIWANLEDLGYGRVNMALQRPVSGRRMVFYGAIDATLWAGGPLCRAQADLGPAGLSRRRCSLDLLMPGGSRKDCERCGARRAVIPSARSINPPLALTSRARGIHVQNSGSTAALGKTSYPWRSGHRPHTRTRSRSAQLRTPLRSPPPPRVTAEPRADIDTIESQLAKPVPNKSIMRPRGKA